MEPIAQNFSSDSPKTNIDLMLEYLVRENLTSAQKPRCTDVLKAWGFDALQQQVPISLPHQKKSTNMGRPCVSFENAGRSTKFDRMRSSPLQSMSREELKIFFDQNLDTLRYLVTHCGKGKLVKEIKQEERERIRKKFSALKCLELNSKSKLPRDTLKVFHATAPEIFPSIYSFRKLRNSLLAGSMLQPEKTTFGYKISVQELVVFILKFIYKVKNGDQVWFAFSMDSTKFSSQHSLLIAIRMISHTSLFQSADDLFTLYRGRCSDDQKSGGIEEAKEIISEIRKMEEYGLAVGENIYNIKFTNVFDLKAAWGVLGRGGGNVNFFLLPLFHSKTRKMLSPIH